MTYKYNQPETDSYAIHYPWKSSQLAANTEFSIGANTDNGYIRGQSWNKEVTSTDDTWGNVGDSADGSIDALWVGKNALTIPKAGTITRFSVGLCYSSYSDDTKTYLLHCPASSVSNDHDGDCTFTVVGTVSFTVSDHLQKTHYFYGSVDCTTTVAVGDLIQIAHQGLNNHAGSAYVIGSATIGIEAY